MEAGQGAADRLDLARAAGRSGASQDRAALGEDGGVLDERGVRVTGVLLEARQDQAAALERLAVGGVLAQGARAIGRPQVRGGEPVREMGARRTNDRLP